MSRDSEQNRNNQEHHEHSHNHNLNQGQTVSFSREVPPTLLRINADNQDKRAVCIFWIIFFSFIVIITIASFFLPRATFLVQNKDQVKGTYLENCANPIVVDNQNVLQCGGSNIKNKIGTLMLNLIRENQFVVAYWKFYTISSTQQMEKLNLTITASFYSAFIIKQETSVIALKLSNQKKNSTQIQIVFRQIYKIYSDDRTPIGYQIPIFIVRNILEQSDVLIVELNQTIDTFPNIASVDSQMLIVNPQFTKYSLAIRYIFFAFSLLGCILYMIGFCKIPADERITQQKMILVLSVLSILFNDPFYPITILYPNKASSYFSVFFVINFIIFLQFLWIIFLDRMYFQDGQKTTKLFNAKRIVFIVITYILVLILYTLIAMDHIQGLPLLYTEDLVSRKFVVLQLASLLFLIVGFGYIIFSYIRLCTKPDQMLWRNQLFLFFSIFFIVLTIVSFFVNGFQINNFEGNKVLILYTAMNIYTYYMQYMYSITKQQRERAILGQIQHRGEGLLQVRSGQGDFVDIEFDDMPGSKILTNEKLQYNQVEKQLKNENQMYSPKYNTDYNNDLKLKHGDGEEQDKQTDFFKEEEDKRVQHQSKNKHQFDEFSLD